MNKCHVAGRKAFIRNPRHLPRKIASRAVLRGPCGTKCESRETLHMNAIKRTRKRPKTHTMLRTIATPPSPRTVSYRCSAEVHGKRAEHGTKKRVCGVGPVPRAWTCARSAPSSSLGRRSKKVYGRHERTDDVTIHRRRARTDANGTTMAHAMWQTANSVCWFSRCIRYDKHTHHRITRH